VSEFRYVATELLTGRVLAESIPLRVQSAARVISAAGQLSGYLPLSEDPVLNRLYITALTPRKSCLWMLQDGYPIWGGIVWDTPHQDVLSNQLPISAKTPESLLGARLIPGAAAFTGDVFDIARSLVQYATGQLIPQIPQIIGPNAGIANLALQSGESGITDSITLGVSNMLTAGGNIYEGTYSNWQSILSALQTLAGADGFEFTFEPTMDASSNLGWLFRLGAPGLGRYDDPGWTLTHPGNVLTYGRPVMGSQAANQVILTSSANGSGSTYTSQSPHGIDAPDLDAGFPLMQVSASWSGVGVTSQDQANAYADYLLASYTAGTMVPAPVIGPGMHPLARELSLGDAINFAATSNLDPADPVTGAPGLQLEARVTGWTVTPPEENQDEKLVPTLGALFGQVVTGTVS
jgi:hypothetical protein